MPYWIFHFFFVTFRFDRFRSVSFRFVWFRFGFFRYNSFRYIVFRFVSICFVSFRLISFRFVRFRFVSFRFYFVSHFTGTRLFLTYNVFLCFRNIIMYAQYSCSLSNVSSMPVFIIKNKSLRNNILLTMHLKIAMVYLKTAQVRNTLLII